MNRLLIPALFVALLFVVPALSQDNQGKVEDMETTVNVLKEKVAAQDVQLKALTDYVDGQKLAAAKLAKALDASKSAGFNDAAITPESREKLLQGLAAFAKSAAAGKAAPEEPETPEGGTGPG